MKMINELRPLYLYSANQKIYAPVDEYDKRHGAAMILLSPSMEDSINMMNLPYIHNPNLFLSYYVDKNVAGYINASDFEELDEVKEKEISESFLVDDLKNIISAKSIKFDIDDDATYIDKSYLFDCFKNKTVSNFVSKLKINIKSDVKVKVIVHHTLSDLVDKAPNNIKEIYHKNFYGYSTDSEIHILSKVVYDQDYMWGDYYLYMLTELYNYIISLFNKEIPYTISKGIALYFSGQYDWLKKNTNNASVTKDEMFIAEIAGNIVRSNKIEVLIEYIKTADYLVLRRYASDKTLCTLINIVFDESDLTAEKRNKLPDSDFGVPSKRAYPLNDENHVRQAIKMFNHCDSKDEKELAEAIIKKMKKYEINDISVSDKNRFSKYYKSPKNESTLIEDSEDDESIGKFEDVQIVCSSLSEDELARISFKGDYEDSKFVIKRIIKYVDDVPAGFLDVHFFPSRPEIAQIVIAVNANYRGQGVARAMIEELLSSDLHKKYGFEVYYWTAHQDNYASQNLAMSSGFEDTGVIDSYGRKVFIKREVPAEDYSREARIHHENTSIINENGSIFILEADTGSQRIRHYLYRERIRTNNNLIEIYNKVKVLNPNIRKTYLNFEMYKNFNLYVDLYYYHELFLLNNSFKLDKGINVYADFLTNLMNVNIPGYNKKTFLIPIDQSTWKIEPGSDVGDYKANINPISLINRLTRTNPEALRRVFGNKTILFVNKRGYFKVDFSRFELKNLNRFNNNIRKLMSSNIPIVDDFEVDEEVNTKTALAAQTIDKIEKEKNITVNNISKINNMKPVNNTPSHLRITTTKMNIEKNKFEDKDVAIINIDPSDIGNLNILKKSPIYRDRLIDVYCVPK